MYMTLKEIGEILLVLLLKILLICKLLNFTAAFIKKKLNFPKFAYNFSEADLGLLQHPMELFVIIVNGFQPLPAITKCSILDVAAVLDSPLILHVRMLISV